eukprot:3940319-Rhodomonas_salina.1
MSVGYAVNVGSAMCDVNAGAPASHPGSAVAHVSTRHAVARAEGIVAHCTASVPQATHPAKSNREKTQSRYRVYGVRKSTHLISHGPDPPGSCLVGPCPRVQRPASPYGLESAYAQSVPPYRHQHTRSQYRRTGISIRA